MILVCPTAFKGTHTATTAAAALAEGARTAAPDLDILQRPLSDGGNGLLEALAAESGGRGRGARVSGPLGTSVTARFLVQDDRVVLETAEACGLHLVPELLRDPLAATSRGVGELLLAGAVAVPPGGTLVVGLGGSATVDAGTGMLTALGWRFLDEAGDPIAPGGAGLLQLARIEPPEEPVELPPLVVLADVTNPLLGSQGAAPVFAPQKGAGPAAVARLERGLERWAEVVRSSLGEDVGDLPGEGAAGGLGAAFAAFLGAHPQSGADWVLDAVGFDDALKGAEVVITGEGCWDVQSSSMGKATGEVVRRCRNAGVPVLLVAGSADEVAPPGVTLVTGSGGTMKEKELTQAVEEALPGLLSGARRA